MLRKTMAVGPRESWVTGYTGAGVANHRACCAEGFAIARGRRGRTAAAGSRKAMSEVGVGIGRQVEACLLRRKRVSESRGRKA